MRKNTSFEKVGEPAVNFFVAISSTTALPVSGLEQGDFSYELINPLGIDVAATNVPIVAELGSTGTYTISFIPTMVGDWTLVVKHATHFPSGKRASYRVFDALYYVEDQAELVEDFVVTDSAGVLQTNVPLTEFVATLYDPTLALSSVPVTYTNVGGGTYRATYEANVTGKWLLITTHPTYFPFGKRNDQRYTSNDTTVIDVVEAMRNLIVADADMRTRLGAYEFTTDVSTPAVFTTSVIPKNCAYPAVIVHRVGGTDFGTRGREGEDTFVEVRIYGDKDRSQDILRRTSNVLRRLLNRAKLTVTDGYRAFRCVADPPSFVPDPDGFPGYLIAVRVLQIADCSVSDS